jgi:Trk K+ transport system NAD-binding subunit
LAGLHVADAGHGEPGHAEVATGGEPGWVGAIRVIGVFGGMFLAGQFILQPVMQFIAKTGVREIFTALALFLVIGAALLMEWLALSHALGAFIVGVILAGSEYRHELESDIEPFKGLLLGLFFISVGMSIEFSVLVASPLLIMAMVVGLVVVKFGVLFALGTLFRLHLADRLLFAILLAQGGEFAFVLLQYALGAGAIEKSLSDILNVTIALSMTITPLLVLAFDRIIAPRLQVPESSPDIPDMGDTHQKVLILGYGRFGQIVARLLHAQGFETVLIDHDPAQIEMVKRFGFKVFYGDAARLDLLQAAGAADAKLIVVAVDDREKISEMSKMIKRHFPRAKLYARAINRGHAFDLMDIEADGLEREYFSSAVNLGVKALVGLGYEEHRARRIAKAFEHHDITTLKESHQLRGDEDAFMGYVQQSRELLNEVMQSDHSQSETRDGAAWHDDRGVIDQEANARTE